jgi:hypothetical protein
MADDIRAQFEAISLVAASVQEIHLELIRRSQHNNFDGAQVCADLLAHRGDWQAVLFDTNALTGGGGMSGLIKLRDLAANFYNVDTLYILAVDEAAGHRLGALAEPWLADNVVIHEQDETDDHLGGCDDKLRLVTMWWD